jgi:hypothetical protein
MSDITMCEGIGCPIREKCYRFRAEAILIQHYFIKIPYEYSHCDKFISYEDEVDTKQIKFIRCQI